MENRYDVVWPGGKCTIKNFAPAKRLDDLNGKVVAELWSYTFKGDVLFEAFEEALQERYPDIKFVNYAEFGEIHGANEREVLAALPEKLKAFGVDAAICGVGGGASGAAADVRTSITVEKMGISTVTILTDAYVSGAILSAAGLGMPNLPFTVHPGHTLLCTDEQVKENAKTLMLDEVINGLTQSLSLIHI